MDALFGTWRQKKGTEKNQEALMEAAGVPAAMQETFKNREYTVTFTKDDNKIKVSVKVANDASLPQRDYAFELGKEFDFVDVDGQNMKAVVTWDGTKFSETYKDDKGSTFEVTRQISGNTMCSSMSVKGVTGSGEWEKC